MENIKNKIIYCFLIVFVLIINTKGFSQCAKPGVTMSVISTNIDCYGTSTGSIDITIAGGKAPYTYSLFSDTIADQSISSSSNKFTFTNLAPGNYLLATQVSLAVGFTFCSQNITITSASEIIVTGSTSNVKCKNGSDGSIDLNVAGGTPPYSFVWSNGASTEDITGLTAGTYSVLIKDSKNCSKSASFNISEPPLLAATGVITNVTCNGGNDGNIDLTVNGGTPPYSFIWSNGATSEDISGLTSGPYSVTITDANNCTSFNVYNITQPTPLVISGTSVNVSCNGGNNGSVTLTVSGGTSPYTYSWSNGATTQNLSSLTAGTYTVTVTDAKSCTKNTSFTITEPTALTVSGTTTNVNCNGGTNGAVNITVGGGTAPYTYSWSNGATTQNISALAAGTYTVTVTDSKGCTKNTSFTVTQPATLTVSGTKTDASCTGVNNGTINLTVAGGTAPYTYSWSNGATTQNLSALAAGTYTVTVTDSKGCTKNVSFTISQPAVMTITNTTTNVSCNGGSNGAIDITVAGGTAPYSYTWSNGVTTQDVSGLTTGSYSVTVKDNNGCSQNASYSVTQPATALTVSGTKTDVTCNGGTNGAINLTVSGGTASYSYSWSNGATTQNLSALAAGTYTVTVTDSKGCTQNASFTISQPAAITISGATVDVSCNGGNNGSVTLTISGGTSPYTYSWSNGATTQNISGLAANTYTVTVTDSKGCTKNASFTINQPTILTVSGTATNVTCNGSNNGAISITPAGGTAPYSYAWSNGATTQNISGLAPNTYSVTVTDSKGCTKSASFTITQPTVLAVSGTSVNVSCNGGNNGSVTLTVSGGTSPYTYSWSNGATTQNLSALAAGTYAVTVTDSKGCTKNASFTITEPAAITLTGTTTNVSCNGGANGAVNLTVTGGTTPYTYAWSNGATTQNISGLTAGTYTVIVTDSKGCTKNTSFTVTQPAVLTVSGTKTDASCTGVNNGTINLTVAGGTAPYTYSWSNGATTQNLSALAAGTYTVTVTDSKGCTQNASFTISQPAVMTITNTTTNVSCNGGSNGAIDITVAGGTAPYSYTWSNGATTQDVTGLTAGSYSVTVKDNNGCSQNASYSVTQPATALTVSGTKTDVTCNGGTNGAINLTVSGGTASYSYSWSNGATTQNLSGLTAGTYTVTVTDAKSCTKNTSFTITEPTALTVSGTTTNVNCNGGTNGAVNITVGGGTAPYTYSWSNGATTQNLSALAAGTYSVTVTDSKGCTKNASFTINQPTILTVSGTATNVTCNGSNNGAISITPAGGTAPYTYSWSNGATTQNISGLAPNTYSVTVTDSKGCTKSASFTITQPTVLAVSGTSVNVSCNGGNNGSVTLTVSGGTSPYTYSWSNGATTQNLSGLTAGTYTVTVTDAKGCTKNASFTITEPAAITLTGTTTNVSCNGGANGAVNLTVTGGTTPYTYAWSNGATTQNISGLTAGTYTVTVTDSKGCTKNTSFTVNQPAALAVSGTSTDPVCNGGSSGSVNLTVTGGTSPYTYAWSNGATTQNLSALAAGTYTVTVTDSKGCMQNASFTLNDPAAIILTSNIFDVSCNGGSDGKIDLFVSNGKPSYSYAWSNGAITKNINGLTAGTYSVVVTDANGCTQNASYTVTQPAPLAVSGTSANVSCNGGNNGSVTLTVSGGTSPYTYSWSNGATTQNLSGLTAGTYSVTVTDAKGCTKNASFTITEPAAITLTGTTTNVSCNGGANGAVNLTVTGGTTPYTYAWSNGATTQNISGLTAGTYTVTVTDSKGCTKNTSFTVTQPAALTVSGTKTDASCTGVNNGTINLTVAGGTAPYTYSWSNGATTQNLSALAAGTYTVTVTDSKGCTQNASFTISQPAVMTITNTTTNVSCNGGSNGAVDITVAGGTAPYSYTWSNGATTQDVAGLTAGSYSVTVKDNNGCSQNASYSVTQPAAALAVSGTKTDVTCNGGTNGAINLTVSGGTASYTYSWSNGATTQNLSGLTAGTYTVTVTDSKGCTQNASFTISQPAAITISGATVDISCNGGNNGSVTLTISGGTSPYTYSWSNGATTQNISGLTANTYTVIVTDSKGCTQNTSFTITEPTPIAITGVSTDPTCKGGSNGAVNLTVTGGTAPYSYLWSNGTTTQNTSGLTAGSYSVVVTDSKGCTKNTSFTISDPAAIAISGTIIDVSCNGGNNGSISVTITNGSSPYSYSWSNGATTQNISGLTAGSYSVTVTDKLGCSQSASFNVIQAPSIVISNTNTDVSCKGGSNGAIDISVSGGTGGYTFLWSSGATTEDISGLTAGTYSVIVTDANSCTQNASFTINEPLAISVTGTTSDASCNGGSNGSINLTVTGGTPSYFYSWNNGATTQNISGLTANTYIVTITDSKGCIQNASFTINEPAPVIVNGITADVTCNGGNDGSINITVSGGSVPYTYNWSNSAATQNISGLAAGPYSVIVTDSKGCTQNASFIINEPAAITLTNIITNVSCKGGNNGSIDIEVTGGNAPYTYVWSNGATTQDILGLTANSYIVTVTDNKGCTQSNTYTITQPTALTVSGVVSDVKCNGGSDGVINLTITGGTAPYTYLWSNGSTSSNQTGLAANTYSVVVTDANGCTRSASFSINEPSIIDVTGTTKDVSCNGGNNGTVNLTVTGGTAPYTYNWSNGTSNQNASGLVAGSYSVIVTDFKGCTQNASFTISEPVALTLSGISTDASCTGVNNGSVTLSVNGGIAPYLYNWSNGANTPNISGLTAGTYSVNVTDNNGCIQNASFTISQPEVMTITPDITDVSCLGGSNGSIDLTVTGGTAPYNYNWSNGATTATISGLSVGNYSLTISDNAGCTQNATYAVIQTPVLTITKDSATDVSCNGGSDGAIYIKVSGGTGPGTYNFLWSNGTVTEDITGLAAGSYSVTVTDGNGCTDNASFNITEPSPVNITNTITDVSCNGGNNGSINITVSGGTSPYTYSWDNGSNTQNLTSLKAGTYTVTVTDSKKCTSSATYTVNEPTAIVIAEAIRTNVSCNGLSDGNLKILVSGGISPYALSWSNGATSDSIYDLAAGNYSITVTDANSCKQSMTFTITQPNTIVINLDSLDNVACLGVTNGAIYTSVSGGTAPFSYSWSNGATTDDITGLGNGTYTVTVKDTKNCTLSKSFDIITNLSLTITQDSLKEPSCNGLSNGAIYISVNNGTGPYNYAWSNGVTNNSVVNKDSITGLNANTYSLNITDVNGCVVSTSINVQEPAVLDLTGSFATPVCIGGGSSSIALNVTGGTSAYIFSSDNITYSLSNGFAASAPGTYKYYVKDSHQCMDSISAILTAYNPVDTAAIVATVKDLTCAGRDEGQISLTNITGGLYPYIFSIDSNTSQTDSLFQQLAKGWHNIIITDNNGCSYLKQTYVDSPLPIDFHLTPTKPETCNNKDAEFILTDVAGGMSPYTYSFNNGSRTAFNTDTVKFQNLSAYQEYTVDIYDSSPSPGCYHGIPIILPRKPGPIPYIRTENAHCHGSHDAQIIVDSLQGGSAPFDIAVFHINIYAPDSVWIKGIGQKTTTPFEGLPADTFAMVIRDKECLYPALPYYLYNGVDYDTIIDPRIVLDQPSIVTVDINTTQTEKHLNMGTALVTLFKGGTKPYWYSQDSITFTPVVNDTAILSGLPRGSHKVFVKDSNNCPYVFEYEIGVGLFIPNLITPNRDGHNDYLEIVGIPARSELRIYNKWGSRIYYNENYDNSWDGENEPDGVYFYELIFPDKKMFKGWVEVTR